MYLRYMMLSHKKRIKFKIEGTTADKRLIAFGANHKELFQNAAIGMISEIVDLGKVGETENKWMEVKGTEDFEGLLIDWLNELLFYYDSENFIGKRFEIKFLEKNYLKALVHGSTGSDDLTIGEIKAATYHEVEILDRNGALEARIILDV